MRPTTSTATSDVAEVGRELGDQCVELARFRGSGWVQVGVPRVREGQFLDRDIGLVRPPLGGAQLREERVPQCPEQISDVVVTPDDAPAGQHLGKRLLHEILRLFA